MSTTETTPAPFFEALHEGASARAREILAAHPGLARLGAPWAAAAADSQALLDFLAEDPGALARPVWAAHGSRNFRSADPEYAAVIERLLAAGATLEPAINKWGGAPHTLASLDIARLLAERGFVPEA